MEEAAQPLQIGAYRIERTLGRGGFGVVYAAVDTRLDRRAAVKQLLPALSHQRDFVERFFREARAAASIDHPGIVEIYDVGWHTDGSAYFAMKLLDGDSLAQRLRARGMLTIAAATTIARQVASAVAAAHAAGIVHRDLKPDNIVLVADPEIGERAVVLDFGIAKLTDDGFTSSQTVNRTVTGVLLGTPLYMSPEQCRGARDVDHRTDVYALGCIVFEMLAGRPPFPGTPGEVVGMHQYVTPPSIRNRADVPPELDAVIKRALAKEPSERFQSLDELAAALKPFAAIDTAPPHAALEGRVVDPLAQTMASMVSSPTTAAASPPQADEHAPGRRRRGERRPRRRDRSRDEAVRDVSRDGEASPRRRWPLVVIAGTLVAVAGIAIMMSSLSSSRHATASRPVVVPPDAAGVINVVERNANEQLVELEHGIAAKKLGLAVRAINRIPPESLVRTQAEQMFAAGEQTLVTEGIAELRALDCDAYEAEMKKRRGEYEQGELYWIAVGTRLACKPSAPLVEPVHDCNPDRHAEANALVLRGGYAQALATFQNVVDECGTNNPMTRVKVVALACRLRNAPLATRHFDKMPPLAQIVIGRLCRDYGVTTR